MINPHTLFIVLTVTSLAFLIGGLAASGKEEVIYQMLRTFAVTVVVIGVVLFITKRYWRDARRLA